jgi:hypothetical protein
MSVVNMHVLIHKIFVLHKKNKNNNYSCECYSLVSQGSSNKSHGGSITSKSKKNLTSALTRAKTCLKS